MNDIDIWQRLARGETRDGARVLVDVRALAELDGARRVAFAGLVALLTAHDDPSVREAAVAFLAGVRGVLGLRRLVAALDDAEAAVREQAVRSLSASAITQIDRWAHVLFHPRPDVRAAGLRIGGPTGAQHLGTYLRTDPGNAALARSSPWPKTPLRLALDLYVRDAATAQELCGLILAAPRKDLAPLLAGQRARSDQELDRALSDARGGRPSSKSDADVLDVILHAATQYPHGTRDICRVLAEAALDGRRSELRRRLVAALLCCPSLQHDAIALASVLDISLLTSPVMSGDAILALEHWLLVLRHQAPKILDRERLKTLLELPLFREPNGAPRVSAAAALCSLHSGRPLHMVIRHFGEDAVIEALRARPEQWDGVCRLPPDTPNTAIALLALMAARDRAVWQRLMAITLSRWSAAQEESRGALLDSVADDEVADVVAAFVDHINQLDEKAAEKATSNVGALLASRLKGRAADAAVDRLLTLAALEASPTTQLLRAALRALPEAELARVARGLAPALQTKLIRLFESLFQLTWAQELAIARELVHAEEPEVQRWVTRLIKGAEAKPPTARPTITGVYAISGPEAARIATCPEVELEKALSRALERPTSGLCAALLMRPDPAAASLSACAALLGCGDPLPEIHQVFERFGSSDSGFLSNLDHAAVTLWQGNAAIPPLGHAWLHRWEQHGFALAAWMEQQDVRERIAEVAALPPGVIRAQLWEAFGQTALLLRYRDGKRLSAWATVEILDILLAALGDTDAAGVAKVVAGLVESRFLGDQLARIRQRILDVAPDLDRETRYRLAALARFEGIPEAPRRAPGEKPPPATVAEVRRSSDLDALLKVCRDSNRSLVAEALLRLLELGQVAGPVFRILAREWPRLACPVPIAESIALWTDEEAIAIVRGLVSDASFSPEARFRAARGLVERGEHGFLAHALDAAVADDPLGWFRPADWSILVNHCDATTCALALVRSPHPHAYQNALEHVLGQPHDPLTATALRDFLAMGPERPLHLRRTAARRLLENGDATGLPVIADQLLDPREGVDTELVRLMPPDLRDAVAATLTTCSLTAGDPLPHRMIVLAASGVLGETAAQNVYVQMLEHSSDPGVRSAASQRAQPRAGREAKLDALARTFAWGVRRGRDLTGRLFRVHMTAKRQDLGYTFLTESRIFVSPLPILRGDNHAQAIVEGLILHELGHHLYHTGAEAAGVWKRADKDGIGPLLNLIADEHLERNLRAVDAAHGDRLKRLGAHAFLHADREVPVQHLLDVLLGGACAALTSVRLGVAHHPGSVEIESGPLLRALAAGRGSFARFVLALRLGQGNRWDDPLVAQALAHFDAGFRRLDMAGLYEVAVAVARLFGGRQAVAALFGGHESIPWSELEAESHGQNISDDEVQREVDRILDPRQARNGPSGGPSNRFALNVNPKEEFDRIERVERLPYDPTKHRPVALSVRRHSTRLRDFIDRLGRSLVPRRARLRGRAFDRTRVRAVVTRRDPRMLVARENEVANDIFLGTIIDCSGSMQAFNHLEKAKRFGVLVAEALRDLPGVEARFFGFTDSVIYDAGDGGRCAVTSMQVGGGNNDAAALFHAARVASASARRTRVLVMVSDGLPTECSTAALRALVTALGRKGFICAQVAVHALEEVCFPSYVVLDDKNLDVSVARFGELIMKLVTRGQA